MACGCAGHSTCVIVSVPCCAGRPTDCLLLLLRAAVSAMYVDAGSWKRPAEAAQPGPQPRGR